MSLIKFGKIFTYLLFRSILFLRHCENSTDARAVITHTTERIYYLYHYLERKKGRIVLSRLRLLFARIIYCVVVVVHASKIISLILRREERKMRYHDVDDEDARTKTIQTTTSSSINESRGRRPPSFSSSSSRRGGNDDTKDKKDVPKITEFCLTEEEMARRNHQPVRVSMDESKRDVVRTTKALIGSLAIKYSVVCQEGCYPDKKKHANQDAFCASAMHGGESLLLGVFDGHGQEGESCAQIASNIFPQILTQLSRESEKAEKAKMEMTTMRGDEDDDDDGENESESAQTEEERLMRLSSSGSEANTTKSTNKPAAKKRDRYEFLTETDLEVKNHCDSPQSNLNSLADRTKRGGLLFSGGLGGGGGSSSNSNSSRERSEEDSHRGEEGSGGADMADMDINPTNMVVKENDISSPRSGRASYTSEDYDDDNNNTKTTKKAGTRTTTHFDEHIYSNAFRTANSIVVKTLGTKCYASGTTAVTALFGKDNIVRFGNVGDSRIICAMSDSDVMTRNKNWKAVQLTRDQTCFRRDERDRMRKESSKDLSFASIGMVLGECEFHEDFEETQDLQTGVAGERCDDPPRVFLGGHKFPGCAFTRSLGDSIAKELGVSAEPELTHHDLNDGKTKCIIIASDGVFEFVSNEEVVGICEEFYPDCDRASKEIVKLSYNKWAIEDERADDVTVIVAYVSSTNDVDMLARDEDESSDDDDDRDDAYLSSSSSLDDGDDYDDGADEIDENSSPSSAVTIRERLQSVNIFGRR
jgi:serine/threonine protein phosphatase PrpC